MSDHPRTPHREPEVWRGTVNPRMEIRTPILTFQVELACPACRPGRLKATGETHESGNIHACDQCPARYAIAGEIYPKRVEQLDPDSSLMRG